MTAGPVAPSKPGLAEKASWLPLIVVVLTQIQASFAVNALTVSMQGITTDLNTPATSVGTAITAGTFSMAAFILLGAKIGSRYGTRKVFQIAVAIHAAAMACVALSVSPAMLFIAQASSGAVIALVAPALTVFIATNYKDAQQAKAIGLLAAAIPAAGVLALLVAGWFATTIGWRYSFGLMVILGAINLLLSFRLKSIPAQPDLKIDWTGAIIAAVSIIFLSFGFSGMASWGIWSATDQAPFNILGVSPAPLLILLGLIGGQVFFAWVRKRQDAKLPRIFDLRVLASSSELAITACMSIMLFVGTAANFLIPLYMQMVQGRSGIETSFLLIPYTLSIFLASTFVAFLYDKFAPSAIARSGFIVVAGALCLIAFSIRNDWGQLFVVLGLVLLGLGQGAIVALVFNSLLSSVPKPLAGDVGAWRGLVHNLSGSVGIAVASAFAVAMLASQISLGASQHPEISEQLISRVNLSDANFMTNAQLEDSIKDRAGSPEELAAAVDVNAEARLHSLQISLLGLAGLAMLAIVPAGRMPKRRQDELPEQMEPDDPDALDLEAVETSSVETTRENP